MSEHDEHPDARYDALAGDEAERLRAGIRGSVLMEALVDAEADVERLREALKQIAGYEFDPDDTYRRYAHEMKRMAREALEAGER